jgi:pilin isopeptide linkage protein
MPTTPTTGGSPPSMPTTPTTGGGDTPTTPTTGGGDTPTNTTGGSIPTGYNTPSVTSETAPTDTDVVFLAQDFSVMISGRKLLTGTVMTSLLFGFVVADSEDNLVATGKNLANGEIHFTPISINTPGIYRYTVLELNHGLEGFSYDANRFEIVVTVVAESTGNLIASVDYGTVGEMVFTNSYTPHNSEDIPQRRPAVPIDLSIDTTPDDNETPTTTTTTGGGTPGTDETPTMPTTTTTTGSDTTTTTGGNTTTTANGGTTTTANGGTTTTTNGGTATTANGNTTTPAGGDTPNVTSTQPTDDTPHGDIPPDNNPKTGTDSTTRILVLVALSGVVALVVKKCIKVNRIKLYR